MLIILWMLALIAWALFMIVIWLALDPKRQRIDFDYQKLPRQSIGLYDFEQ